MSTETVFQPITIQDQLNRFDNIYPVLFRGNFIGYSFTVNISGIRYTKIFTGRDLPTLYQQAKKELYDSFIHEQNQ